MVKTYNYVLYLLEGDLELDSRPSRRSSIILLKFDSNGPLLLCTGEIQSVNLHALTLLRLLTYFSLVRMRILGTYLYDRKQTTVSSVLHFKRAGLARGG